MPQPCKRWLPLQPLPFGELRPFSAQCSLTQEEGFLGARRQGVLRRLLDVGPVLGRSQRGGGASRTTAEKRCSSLVVL